MDNKSFIQTVHKNCLGCNKCVFTCPTKANESFFESEEGKVFIKPGYCISCGECINICDHDARDYIDDTTRFFGDIKDNKNISVVIAPSAGFNFEDTKKLIGYLKSLGVNKVYDVSLGADICTWAHVKLLKEGKVENIISQPCPVVVSYIEKYQPELIEYLSPIHSPVISLAVYLKKYLGIQDKIMFLSPCIGKMRECVIEETDNLLEYNVTFLKFSKYLDENGIYLNEYPTADFDNIKGSIGFSFPRPGGLCENIKYHIGKDMWIKQVEGITEIQEYLGEYLQDVREGRPVPAIVDALNCKNGCNLGTGTSKSARLNDIDYKCNKAISDIDDSHSKKLTEYFNNTLNIEDFRRVYVDRSKLYRRDENIDLEAAYLSLGKVTAEDRKINCFCCGYGNCEEFVYDLATGHNDKNNCRHYLLNKFKKISLIDNLTETKNRYCYEHDLVELKENHPGFIGIIFVDINGLKQVNDTLGHKFGDELIVNCSNLLKVVFKSKVYRIGGDEFIIIEDGITEDEFSTKIKKLAELLGKEESLRFSYGSAISRTAEDLSERLKDADQEMYQAKREFYASRKHYDRRTGRDRRNDEDIENGRGNLGNNE